MGLFYLNNIMNIIFPIKFERANTHRKTKIIDWRLSNVCNFNCSFCPSNFKDGSKRPLKYEKYISLIDNLISSEKTKIIWFQFTGGEPTLYSKLKDLLKYIKNNNGFTSIISNGSRTIRWWSELAKENILDRLYLTYHPEQEKNPYHIIEVNNLMQESNTFVTMFITTQYHKDLFDKAITDFSTIKENANTICSLKPISDDEYFQPYSADQLKIIQENLYVKTDKFKRGIGKKLMYLKSIPWYQSNMTMLFNDESRKTHPAQYFAEHNLNNFKNWECDIGKDLLVIEIDEVYRGMCREGGLITNINENTVSWQNNSIICQKEKCNCSLDLQEPKRKILIDKN